jgi:hypothetical protein
MSLYKFKPSKQKREEGILVEVISTGDYPVARVVKEVGDLPTFRISQATDENPVFEKAKERHLARYRKAKDEGKLSEHDLATMYNECFQAAFVEAALLGWYNVASETGEPLTLNPTTATRLLQEIPEVENCLYGAAFDRRHFRIDLPGSVEADAKNS